MVVSRPGCERPPLCHRHATESQGTRARGPHPTTTSADVQRPIIVCEATEFGKEFLRMAGIVQMLHALYGVYDKYPYAHTTRVRQAGSTRDQVRSASTVSLAVLGPCHTVLVLCHHTLSHRVLTCPVWLILIAIIKLVTIRVPSIRVYTLSTMLSLYPTVNTDVLVTS